MPVVADRAYVEVSEVSKIYRTNAAEPVEAVSSVSFTVPHGQFVAILGPSGCGKSTLLMMCGGLEAITAGQITVDAAPMTGPRTSIGIMFQDSTLLPWKSALDNVLFPIRVLKRPLSEYRDAAQQLLERVGLEDFAHKKPHELSGGMRQRVAICRALVYDPELLLMDEPFSALDAITRDEMNELLLDLWQQYTKTALFVTHSIREAVLLADRVLVMTRRPATIVEDLTIPFPRPRSMALGENKEFNEICGHLRERIEEGHYRQRR
ncbi:MAG TPA: ABC transporter ATP-binding protein [Stellaceae bacterium]|jgi:NitT/TauT family transport system ATP-binding protein|nr:ABC transporter ATP-binding protein [Stellaceae bacterium]